MKDGFIKVEYDPEMRLSILRITLKSYHNDVSYTDSRIKIMKEIEEIKKSNPELFV